MTGFKVRDPPNGHSYRFLWKNYCWSCVFPILKYDIPMKSSWAADSEYIVVQCVSTRSSCWKSANSLKKQVFFAKKFKWNLQDPSRIGYILAKNCFWPDLFSPIDHSRVTCFNLPLKTPIIHLVGRQSSIIF